MLLLYACRQALEKAQVLLEINHSIHKLDQVWGQGGGNRPVKYLTNKVNNIIDRDLLERKCYSDLYIT